MHLRSFFVGIGVWVLFIIGLCGSIPQFTFGQQTQSRYDKSFVEKVQEYGIDIQTIQNQASVSRYEVARLLNLVECKDCLDPNQSMIQNYTLPFWSNFITLPGRDFQDIDFEQGLREGDSYYYCVAYVGDQEYMRGYPLQTSPVCRGGFCGERPITKAEFIQVVINIAEKYIYENYRTDRSQIYEWKNSLEQSSYASKNLTVEDINTIDIAYKQCSNANCRLNTRYEFETYLKFCMFNLESCQFSSFGWIKENYRPVSELNIMQQERLLPLGDTPQDDIHQPVNGAYVVDVLGELHKKVGCVLDGDYDCDGIPNPEDSCIRTYNPSQNDRDNDGIGDVCDNDIDNDGQLNPVGIVDDGGVVVVELYDDTTDPTLFSQQETPNQQPQQPVQNTGNTNTNPQTNPDGSNQEPNTSTGSTPQGNLQQSSTPKNNKNHSLTLWTSAQGAGAGLTHGFVPTIGGQSDKIMRDFGDGTVAYTSSTRHTYINKGTYVVTTTSQNNQGKAIAKMTVHIPQAIQDPYGLAITSRTISSAQPYQTTLGTQTFTSQESTSNANIHRYINNQKTQESTLEESYKFIGQEAGQYAIQARLVRNGTLVGLSQYTTDIGQFIQRGSIITTDTLNATVGQTVRISTQRSGREPNDVASIQWFDSKESIATSGINLEYSFDTPGNKIIRQEIRFVDGAIHSNILTIHIAANTSNATSYTTLSLPKSIGKAGEEFTIVPGLTNFLSENIQNITIDYGDGTKDTLSFEQLNTPLEHTYARAGVFSPLVTINTKTCATFQAQATIRIEPGVNCLDAKLSNTLGQFRCDMDQDGTPDICDSDIDGDGIPNQQGLILFENQDCSYGQINDGDNTGLDTDIDGDGIPNIRDSDIDGDGIPNDKDPDMDGDGIPNTKDVDIDGDGIPNAQDSNPNGNPNGTDQTTTPLPTTPDIDGDGIANVARTGKIPKNINPDAYNVSSCSLDATPFGEPETDQSQTNISTPTPDDIDGDGIPNDKDPDMDGDGIANPLDGDTDGDGIDNPSDEDSDNDGIKNNDDDTPLGDSDLALLDRDNDGILDINDTCPLQPETYNGIGDIDGCPEPDTDGDGLIDEIDKCINDPENVNGLQDTDGCPELDTDGDGILDKDDFCPLLPENFNGYQDLDGCPELGALDPCFEFPEIPQGFVAAGTCNQCPCPYADFGGELNQSDKVRAVLKNKLGTKIYGESSPYEVRLQELFGTTTNQDQSQTGSASQTGSGSDTILSGS